VDGYHYDSGTGLVSGGSGVLLGSGVGGVAIVAGSASGEWEEYWVVGSRVFWADGED
jgi:hypothetical protein